MSIALCTTTIYVPEVLKAYRDLDSDVQFVVAGDLKTPRATEYFCAALPDCLYLSPADQDKAYPGLSKAIGWNKVMRRNLAILEAAKLGTDYIVSIDDDNAPLGDYFAEIEDAFKPRDCAVATGDWFDLGNHAQESFRYRGLPYGIEIDNLGLARGTNLNVGVVNGLIFGDPDINAVERICCGPEVTRYSDDAMRGIAVDPRETWTSVNSQNTAWRAELAPLMAVLPEVGRYDDIWGSYIAQRVLSATDYHTLFGRPFVRQDRNDQDVFRNLVDEMLGMRKTEEVIECLESASVRESASILDNLSAVLEALRALPYMPGGFFTEWLEAWA